MSTNLERFKKDLEILISKGGSLALAMNLECFPKQMREVTKKQFDKDAEKVIEGLPSFKSEYQSWYSEAQALLRQVLPDRVSDFVRHYEKPKNRKEITYDTYRVEDYLQGLQVTRGYDKEKVVGADAAIPHFQQQLAIIEAAKRRFDSSLFEIRQLVQADFLDSEISTAEELAKHKFVRAAGALAGVAVERHLAQVCNDHQLTIAKKNPTIADFNEALKSAAVIDLPQWRFIQHLADIRNLCDHSRKPDPTAEQVADLIAGAKKVTKTVY